MPSTPFQLSSQIRKIIAIASGKGGVGKSTVATHLAFSFQSLGLKVGLLDADIYGPSLPKMLGFSAKPQVNEDKKMIPLEISGLQCMSMGFLLPEETPAIWRGPMIQKSLQQFFEGVAWQNLDILVVDLPPGTGDAQLTLAQKVSLDGVIIVSTPQEIALIDARKALGMFQRLETPILGMIENMSSFKCPHCQEETAIFQSDGVRKEAEKNQIPFLGDIPLVPEIAQASEAGQPLTLSFPQHSVSQIYKKVADQVWNRLIFKN